MKKLLLIAVLLLPALQSPAQRRHEIVIPAPEGYVLLKGDFHIHTVFSDGNVMPSTRMKEAYVEGLDVLSITDHIERQRWKTQGIIAPDNDLNKSYELAAKEPTAEDLILIRGGEITRGMPPGHANAIFVNDVNPLKTDQYVDAYRQARRQGAIIFWNHPGWERQQPDTTIWMPEHESLYAEGLMDGIEVCGYRSTYFPEAHKFALEKNLIMFGNTDSHQSMGLEIDFVAGQHRNMTLIMARERSAEGVKEALLDRRTVVYHKDQLIGADRWVRALFESCVRIEVKPTKTGASITMTNLSCIPFHLFKRQHDMRLNYFRNEVLAPFERATFAVTFKDDAKGVEGKPFCVDFDVENCLVGPNVPMKYSIEVK